jgi:hypothetical protein
VDTELERFKIEVVLPEFAATRGYSLDRRASSRNSIVMRHPDGDKIIIGDIMLLIPGIMLTNSIRDILLGDIISGSLRQVEAILMAATLALGMMAAIWLMGGISA